jgi:hypothetical protein
MATRSDRHARMHRCSNFPIAWPVINNGKRPALIQPFYEWLQAPRPGVLASYFGGTGVLLPAEILSANEHPTEHGMRGHFTQVASPRPENGRRWWGSRLYLRMRRCHSKDIVGNAVSLAPCRVGRYVPLSLDSSLPDEQCSGIFHASHDARFTTDHLISLQLVTCDARTTMSVVFYCCNFLGRQ